MRVAGGACLEQGSAPVNKHLHVSTAQHGIEVQHEYALDDDHLQACVEVARSLR